MDADTEKIVLWNPAATQIFGYSLEEAKRIPLHCLVRRSFGTGTVGRHRAIAIPAGDLIDQHTILELPALHKEGHELTIEFSLTPIEHASKSGRFVMAIIRDVTSGPSSRG